MITREKYCEINDEIKLSVTSALDELRNLDLGNYILFLADAEYFENSSSQTSPYRIDNRLDTIIDSTRIEFLSKFLTEYYRFPLSQSSTDDDSYRMNLELMVYSHLWESKSYLKKLYRLANLLDNKDYEWEVQVPPMGKHKFIRNEIRGTFKKNNITLGEVIKNGFHTSLRNAFAHSEYSFDRMNKHNRINLYNYGGENWELRSISFDDWSLRFVYSALLGYYFLKIILERRLNLIEENNCDSFIVKIPTQPINYIDIKVQYKKDNNSFIQLRE